MKCQRRLLQIKWHQFVRNDAIAATTCLPSISETISRRRNALFGHVARLPDDVHSRLTRHSTAKSTYLWADHQAANGIAVPVVLTTDGLTRSRMTTTYHLPTSGGALSVVVITERRYGSCWLSDDNNNNNRSTGKLQFQPILSSIY